MAIQPSLSLSWVGSSCLCPQDAERELVALREKVILPKGALKKSTARRSGADNASGGPYSRRRSSHPPPNATTPLAEKKKKKKCLTPSKKLTSDEVVVKIQEETEALRQALAENPDYRLAQCSMDRLDGLESALWEAHAAEARAAAHLETLELQREQETEEETLEADLKRRVDRLRETCDQRASTLRREHEVQLDKLDRDAGGGCSGGGGGGGGRGASATTPGSSAPAQVIEHVTASASTSALRQINHQTKGKQGPDDTTSNLESQEPRGQNQESKKTQEQQQQEQQQRGEEGRETCFTHQPPPPPVVVTVTVTEAVASVPVPETEPEPEPEPEPVLVPVLVPEVGVGLADHARKKEMVDLRGELGRHLAVAHADGGRHLREATRVMRLIEEVEAQTRLEAEVKARSGLDSLEKISLRQKHAQAEGVQRDKHDRLLRSLERSRAEQLRLVSARHHGALGRLTERRRDINRRRKHELRERLAAAKGGVARAWREHNRFLFLGAGRAAENRCAARENGGPLEKRAAAPAPVPVVGSAAAAVAAAAAAAAAAVAAAAATGSGGNEVEPQCQAGEVGELRGDDTTADAKVAADGGFVCENQTDTSARTPPEQGCDSVPRAREASAPEAGGGKTRAFVCPDTTADTTSAQQKKQPPRRAATLSPAATSTTFLRGRGRSRGRGNTAGVPARRPQKRRATSTTTTDTSDESPELPTTTAAFAVTAFVSGAVGVLKEEEVQALAALGRGTPNDPRLLLVASRPPPESRARVEVPRRTRKALMMRTRGTRDDDDFYCDKKSYRESDGGRAVGTAVRGRGNSVLERAVDKLVPEMRAREEVTRRSFGMPSLASS